MAASNSNSFDNRLGWTVGAIVVGIVTWVLFFDSHSLLKRYYWQQELESLTQENKRLRTDIERLQTKLDKPLPDSVVERIAREEYGMKQPGETIYQIEFE